MKIGMLILNFNDWERALALAGHSAEYKTIDTVLIVDNCSTDDSREKLQQALKNQEKIRLLKSERNGGYAYGNNFGMKYLRDLGCEAVLISNTDVEFSEGFLIACRQALMQGFSMVSGLMRMGDGSLPLLGDYHINSFREDIWDSLILGRALLGGNRYEPLQKQEDNLEPMAVQMIPGSLFLVNTEDFFAAGGFDEGTFLYCEERILGRRMGNSGRKLGLLLSQEYLHNHSASISKVFNQNAKMKLWHKSKLYYHRTYNAIGPGRELLLKAVMAVSRGELLAAGCIKSLLRR